VNRSEMPASVDVIGVKCLHLDHIVASLILRDTTSKYLVQVM
jgi:hypothetical protein